MGFFTELAGIGLPDRFSILHLACAQLRSGPYVMLCLQKAAECTAMRNLQVTPAGAGTPNVVAKRLGQLDLGAASGPN